MSASSDNIEFNSLTDFKKADWLYEKIRERVREEDKLYNQRIIWLISMQAFLFATLGLILRPFLSTDANDAKILLAGCILIVATTGVLVAIVADTVLSNGRDALNGLRDHWTTFADTLSDEIKDILPHPRGKFEDEPRENVRSRGMSSGNLPVVFMFVWSVLIVFFVGHTVYMWGNKFSSVYTFTIEIK